MHFGLLPRANRGIFAINELPDLAGKIQVGLFNILQEGDVQIKGYPVRLPLDVLIAFTANPEDYTARGKIITPLKDRIGAEIRTHYMQSRADALTITDAGSVGLARRGRSRCRGSCARSSRRSPSRRGSERKIDKRSGVSQRMPISVLETVISNAERRALGQRARSPVVPRVTDVYAALPSMTGKFELEYEGELKGADQVARDLVRAAVANVFEGYFARRRREADHRVVRPRRLAEPVGHDRRRDAGRRTRRRCRASIELAQRAGVDRSAPRAGASPRRIDFLLEGLVFAEEDQPQRRARGYHGAEPAASSAAAAAPHARSSRRMTTRTERRRPAEEEVLQLRLRLQAASEQRGTGKRNEIQSIRNTFPICSTSSTWTSSCRSCPTC